MAKRKPKTAGRIENRRARYDYDLGDSLIVGLSLTGAEVKSLRRGHGHLRGAYVTNKDDELWLVNATITGDSGIKISEQEQTRARKVLAKRREINELLAAKQQGRTIIPLELLTQGRYIKLRIAAARGKRKHDKRETLKMREAERSSQRALSQR